MPTLTYLEDQLRDPDGAGQARLVQLSAAAVRLQAALATPSVPQQHQQITLLLEAVNQAENIIQVLYYRYQSRYKIL